jgi:aminopeptidase N
MENWGLITYRETAMLYKPGVSALRSKEQIASVIAHELAHQWFGKYSYRRPYIFFNS